MSNSNTDNKFLAFMKKAGSIIILNFLWFVFSLPVVTMGAATCAAFFVCLKIVDDKEVEIGKAFVKAFKGNFKQGTLMSIITIPCVWVGYIVWKSIIAGDASGFFPVVGALIFTAISVCVNLYAYALIAHYENTFKNILRNSIIISLLYFTATVMTVIAVGVEVFVLSFNFWTRLAAIIIGPGLIIFTISSFCKKIFKAVDEKDGMIIPPKAEESDITEEDEEILEENDLDEDEDDDEDENASESEKSEENSDLDGTSVE